MLLCLQPPAVSTDHKIAVGAIPCRPLHACAGYDGQQQFQRAITSVAAQAAGAMLALLKQELGLRSVLQAIKAYQLCGRGDFLTAFMDAAGDTLGQALGGDARHRGRLQRSLQELLDLGARPAVPTQVVVWPAAWSKPARGVACWIRVCQGVVG